jgi:hypothetical protein
MTLSQATPAAGQILAGNRKERAHQNRRLLKPLAEPVGDASGGDGDRRTAGYRNSPCGPGIVNHRRRCLRKRHGIILAFAEPCAPRQKGHGVSRKKTSSRACFYPAIGDAPSAALHIAHRPTIGKHQHSWPAHPCARGNNEEPADRSRSSPNPAPVRGGTRSGDRWRRPGRLSRRAVPPQERQPGSRAARSPAIGRSGSRRGANGTDP